MNINFYPTYKTIAANSPHRRQPVAPHVHTTSKAQRCASVCGIAMPYGQLSAVKTINGITYRTQYHPGAFDKILQRQAQARKLGCKSLASPPVLIGHDEDQPLHGIRNLQFQESKRGLFFTADILTEHTARQIAQLGGVSLTVKHSKRYCDDDRVMHIYEVADICDLSFTNIPAFEGTSVTVW